MIYCVFMEASLLFYHVNLPNKPINELELSLFIDKESEAQRLGDKPDNVTKPVHGGVGVWNHFVWSLSSDSFWLLNEFFYSMALNFSFFCSRAFMSICSKAFRPTLATVPVSINTQYLRQVVVCGLVTKSCPTLATPWAVAHQASLSMEFSRKESWSGFLFPSPGGLPDPGIIPESPE